MEEIKTQSLAVSNAQYLDDLRLEIQFTDGTQRLINSRPTLERQEVPEYRAFLNPEKSGSSN